MHEIGAIEAEGRLGHLLDLVEQGEEVSITRHGREVARLVPARARADREQARAAVRRLRERAEARTKGVFDWTEWRAWRDAGRP